jgi:hypothetical protein
MLDTIIKLADKIDERIYILSLDAKKAFDSVDHKFMYSTLRAYGFGEEFIKTIQTIYKDLTASVMVNGFKSGVIRLLRGVKQGDALSCALFVIIIDPMLRAVERSNEIKSLEITSPFTNKKVELKISGYADDLTPVVNSLTSVQNVFHLYHRFSKVSGLYLNAQKTEILCIGGIQPAPQSVEIEYGDQTYDIVLSQRIKVCGISHPIADQESYNLNIKNNINKLKMQLNMWKSRNLSLKGKILITKVFGLSQLIYFLQTCPILTVDLKKIESLLYGFIWSSHSERPNDKIQRAIMKSPTIDGGLSAPDIFSLDTALKYRRWIRTASKENHPVSALQDRYLYEIGIVDKIPHLVCQKLLKKLPDQFYKVVFLLNNKIVTAMHNEIKSLVGSGDSISTSLLNFIANTPIASSPEITSYLHKTQLRLQMKFRNLTTYGLIIQSRQLGDEGGNWLTTLQAFQKIPIIWTNLLRNNPIWNNGGQHSIPFITDKKGRDFYVNAASTKHIRTYLTDSESKKINMTHLLLKHNFDPVNNFSLPNNPFDTWFTTQTYYQSFHFRVLHRAITTRAKLELYRILDSAVCPFCEEAEDDFEHALYKCPLSRFTWQNFQTYLGLVGVNFTVTTANVIFGIPRNIKLSGIINIVLTRIKKILLSPSSDRRCLSVDEIINIAKDQFQLELAVAKRHPRIPVTQNYVFNKKWETHNQFFVA